MGRKTFLKLAEKNIIETFQKGNAILLRDDIEKIFFSNKDNWRLSQTTTVKDLINLLLKNNNLEEHIFNFPNRIIKRYTLKKPSIYEVVSTIRNNAYFSHYSAVYLHQLTEQEPKNIYLNYEQSVKPKKSNTLSQSNIDMAFSKKPKITNNIAKLENGIKVTLLNGMNTKNLGVINMELGNSTVLVTNIERTLIDITVRSNYSGGVFEVLKAYELAKNKVSINKLISILKKIDYIYPYHQVIGFYLEKAGYKESQINLIKNIDKKYDFYLTYQMTDMEYSKEWRLFYPKNF